VRPPPFPHAASAYLKPRPVSRDPLTPHSPPPPASLNPTPRRSGSARGMSGAGGDRRGGAAPGSGERPSVLSPSPRGRADRAMPGPLAGVGFRTGSGFAARAWNGPRAGVVPARTVSVIRWSPGAAGFSLPGVGLFRGVV
jgi:hypothetical protein